MTGLEIAQALARATGGAVLELPCDPRYPAWSVGAALVRQHPGFVRVTIGKRSWAVMSDQAMPGEVALEAKRWAELHPDATTLADAGVALVSALERALGFSWVISIPGGQHAPTELWLRPSTDEARASVGVHVDGFHVGDDVIAMPKRRQLDDACARAITLVRVQLERFTKNVALSEACTGVALELAKALGMTTRTLGSPAHDESVAIALVDGAREVARIEARGDGIHVDAGLPGALGWHGTADEALAAHDALAHAIEAMSNLVTLDTLERGTRYRVLEPFSGLKADDIVEYGGPIDNHAPHSFFGEASGEVLVDESALRENAHRVLGRL